MNADQEIARIARIAKQSKLKSKLTADFADERRPVLISAIFGNFGIPGNSGDDPIR
jgi:hypothetical protein